MENVFKLGQLVKFVSGPDSLTEEKIAELEPHLQNPVRNFMVAQREKAPQYGLIVEIAPSHYLQEGFEEWGCCRVLIVDEYRNEIRTCNFKNLSFL